MQYRCTVVEPTPYNASGQEFADSINHHMAAMAEQGWRLVSTADRPGTTNVFLYWARD